MKPSILVVMLDFLVCSLLLFVIGTGGKQTQFATSAPAVHEEFSPSAMQTQQEEWNRDYEQQALRAQLQTETTEKDQLRIRLTETSATLADREANLKTLAAEKARVEQAKAQTEQALNTVESNLTRISAERQKLQQEGEAAKERLGKLQTELTGLQTQQAKLQQERAELAQHAEQLGQTVSKQQATINLLSEGIVASQARLESQFTDFTRDQQQMASTLKQLDEFTRTLPATVQNNVTTVRDDQQRLQENLAALTEAVRSLQAEMGANEQGPVLQAVADVAKGQQDLQTRLDTLIKTGQGTELAQSLNTIQTGQDSLRQQTAKLAEQIETIKARGPGPFKAVKNARLELLVAIAQRDNRDGTTARFKATAYPPVVRVDGRTVIVANYQTFGLGWWALGAGADSQSEISELKCTVGRRGEPSWSAGLTAPVCALKGDARVVTVEVNGLAPEVKTMELAGADAALQGDQRKLHVFKSTAAGLSFEVDTSPDLGDARYLVIQRQLRGVASWFENPAYRADAGDYVVTPDGKLVGIMVSRERCFVLSKENLLACAASVPLADKQAFARAVRQFPRVK